MDKWQGADILALIILAMLGKPGIDIVLGGSHSRPFFWPFAITLLFTAIGVWLLAQHLVRKPMKVLVEPATNQLMRLKGKHGVFPSTMQWVAALVAVATVIVLFP